MMTAKPHLPPQDVLAPDAAGTLDPLILEAAKEVDQSLLDWMLSLSPRERLRTASNATRALGKFRRVAPGTR